MLLHIVIILAVGTAAGFINVLAGGGSLLTLPVLIFTGLPPATANGTNRIALLVQNLVAVENFRRKGFFDWRLGLLLGLPAVAGSIVGAHFAVSLSGALFNKILAIIMIIVLIFILFQPHKRWLKGEIALTARRKWLAGLLFFFIGIYGGFIQAGVGFIIIAGLALITGMSLAKINSLKVFVIGLYTISSLAVFVFQHHVNWTYGLSMAVGNSFGAWLGSNIAVSKGDGFIRIVLAVSVVAMAAKLFFF